MFLFMYSGNNQYPVNLKEQTLFEVIIPTSDYYQSNKKRGENCLRKCHILQSEWKQEN